MDTPFGLDWFEDRRRAFFEAMGSGVAVIPAARAAEAFRQDPDFWMLTGFPEPDAVALLDPAHPKDRYTLFVRPRDELAELWDGVRIGPEDAVARFGADAAYPLAELDAKLREHLVGNRSIVYRLGNSAHDARVTGLIDQARGMRSHGVVVPDSIVDPAPVLSELRLRKTPQEVDALRRACEISASGHTEAMRVAAPGMHEFEVQAALEHRFRTGGSMRNAFATIVASGANACVLHYVSNDAEIAPGDLVLIDAGAEYSSMAGDISRTFPADGTFTGPQRELYEVVLSANLAAIGACGPGTPFEDVHEAARRALVEGLVRLGLLPLSVDESLAMVHDRVFFPHGTSHWLGMDVHDVGATRVDRRPRPLEAGMAFTVEPGLYVPADRATVDLPLLEVDRDAVWERRLMLGPQASRKVEDEERETAAKVTHEIPERFRGVGIRIEDDVLIGPGGAEVMTSDAPKSIAEVEAACAEASMLGAVRP